MKTKINEDLTLENEHLDAQISKRKTYTFKSF